MTVPLPAFPARRLDSHKGDFGKLLVVGGSLGMSGAPALTGKAALRTGTGLVRLAVPQPCLQTVAALDPCYMTVGLPADTHGRLDWIGFEQLQTELAWAQVAACGPGLGSSRSVTQLVNWMYDQVPLPLVVDADALNGLANRGSDWKKPAGPRILTPHPGEFARLVREPVSVVQHQRQEMARQFAKERQCVLVLKGHQTVVTNGEQTYVNATGNPGMATGGAGDVLTGVIASLVGQGLSPWDAARLGVHLHGRAGDIAALRVGPVGLVATDIIAYLPAAIGEIMSQPG